MTADVGLIREVGSSFEANQLLGKGWHFLGFYTKAWDASPNAPQVPIYIMGEPRNTAEG